MFAVRLLPCTCDASAEAGGKVEPLIQPLSGLAENGGIRKSVVNGFSYSLGARLGLEI